MAEQKISIMEHLGQSYIGLAENDSTVIWAKASLHDCMQVPAADLKAFISKHPCTLPSQAHKAPIFYPSSRIFCVGKNYLSHAQEMGSTAPAAPDIFTRTQESFVTDGQAMIKPAESEHFDYEGELVIIIGKEGRHISEDNAMDHIYGYSIANDGSMRDWQLKTSQFTLGKNWDSSGAISNTILLQSDQFDPQNLQVTTLLNDTIVQDQSTAMMIFSLKRIIHTLSTVMTLKSGDIILTGTPEGVGAARTPPLFLKTGDNIKVSIKNIGSLCNHISSD